MSKAKRFGFFWYDRGLPLDLNNIRWGRAGFSSLDAAEKGAKQGDGYNVEEYGDPSKHYDLYLFELKACVKTETTIRTFREEIK